MSASRVRVYLGCSFDGYIAGPDDDLSFLHEPPPEGAPSMEGSQALGFEDFMGQVGAMLMGRRTYDTVEGMGAWPYGETTVLVATRRALTPMAPGVRAVTGDIDALIRQAKEAAGEKDVYLDGGDLVRQALGAGLVDELCLTFVPTLLGGGVQLFGGLVRRSQLEFTAHHRMGHMVQVTARVLPG
jgi:dihydrofolate reductase